MRVLAAEQVVPTEILAVPAVSGVQNPKLLPGQYHPNLLRVPAVFAAFETGTLKYRCSLLEVQQYGQCPRYITLKCCCELSRCSSMNSSSIEPWHTASTLSTSSVNAPKVIYSNGARVLPATSIHQVTCT